MENIQKYFKIVNPDGHNGLVYHEGYNEDHLPFNPSGDCKPGGIYFASSDILVFLNYGTELYEVEPIGEIYENPGDIKKYKAHALNMKYIGNINDVNTIKYLVENGANIHADDDSSLQVSAEYGNLEVVKYLVKHGADIHAKDDVALRWSVEKGHLEVVKYLVEQGANIHADDDASLRSAAYNGRLEVVKYLIGQGANIHADNDASLRRASLNGHLYVVNYLKNLNKKN